MKPHLLGVSVALALVVTVGAGAPAATADVDCPQTRAVFYTTDTQNLARALGANKSDCADYYISITPMTAPPTGLPRGGAALTIVQAQGPRVPRARRAAAQAVGCVRGCQRLVCDGGDAPRRHARGRL